MAKLKKKPINLDPSVKVQISAGKVTFEGSKGSFWVEIPQAIEPQLNEGKITLKYKKNNPDTSLLGLYYSLLRNAVKGVSTGWQKTLEMVGVGYRASTDGQLLTLNVGFTHPVKIQAPAGITFKVEENKILVSGADKYQVGETAATIRRVRPPEPYKGKGIRYQGEIIRKKAGKAAKAIGAMAGK